MYYILRLKTNIVSIGQLDEARYKIDIDEDIIQIREPSICLLMRVNHGPRGYTCSVSSLQV